MNVLLHNGQIIKQGNQLIPADVWLEAGKIKAIGTDLAASKFAFDLTLDAGGGLIAPGLVDLHVHLREPGYTYKETIKSGSRAAAHGGYTTICAMPNLNPVPDTAEKLTAIYQLIDKDAAVHVKQYAPITEALRSEKLVDQVALKKAGAFAFTNDGVGVQTAGVMYQAMQAAAANEMAIVAHTEDESLLFGGVMHQGERAKALGLPGIVGAAEASQIARDVILAAETGVHYHVCHVSAKASVEVIRAAKQQGVWVTAEVCPHHLLLCDEDILADDGNYKMNPPLRSRVDREALIAGLLDGTIDCIATDHAPHSYAEKHQSMRQAPFGIVGSETAFALLYTEFVEKGIFTLEQLITWMSTKPADLFNLPAGHLAVGEPADISVFDLKASAPIEAEKFESMSSNTPFIGWQVQGLTRYTIVGGQVVWSRGGR